MTMTLTARSGVTAYCLVWMVLAFESPSLAQQWDISQDVDPNRVVGHQQCAECHQSEVEGWKKSHHATESYKLLEGADAKAIADKLNISAATEDQRCTTCHTTQMTGGSLKAVSCESCHSHAGPLDDGWISVHSALIDGVKNPSWADRTKESVEHANMRLEASDQLGMRRPENIYALAKNCFECHVVGSEVLVNEGGHPGGKTGAAGIEFVKWSSGEVRHNFQRNPDVNAEVSTVWLESRLKGDQTRTVDGRKRVMYVVGQLADLEVSLRNRAKATTAGTFLTTANTRIKASSEALSGMRRARIDQVDAIVEKLEDIEPKLDTLAGDDQATFTALADQVAAAGKDIAKSNGEDGRWSRLDRIVPQDEMGKAP